MKRIFDFSMAALLLVLLALPMALIAVLVKATSKGPVLYWSDRVGKDNVIFRMPKFRTMSVDTPAVATHLMDRPDAYLTGVGPSLRALSLDELPQIWSVLTGRMSFVGPRPALFNQHDLIELRTRKRVHTLVPGITGWAQVNGRDELPIPVKVDFDEYYLKNRSFSLDMRIIFMTVFKVLRKEGVRH
jgi:O-antigen biosynthesis protein WbqP